MRRDDSHDSLLNQSLLEHKNTFGADLSPNAVASSPTNNSSPVSVMTSLEDFNIAIDVELLEQEPIRLDTIFNKHVNAPPPRHPSIPLRKISKKHSQSRRRYETVGNFWNAKGLNKAKSGEWENAVVFWENALEARIQAFGENHVDVANTLNNIGIALGQLERFDEAIKHLNLVREIREEYFGACHLEIAATLHNIANVFQQMKDYDSALQYFNEAKCMQEALLSHNDMLVVRTACAIGHLHYEHGHYEDALQAYEQARESMEEVGVREGNFEYDNLLLDISDSKNAVADSL